MKFLFTSAIILVLLQYSVGRPTRIDEENESDADEVEYEVDGAAENSLHDEDAPANEKRIDDQDETEGSEDLQEVNRNVNMNAQRRNVDDDPADDRRIRFSEKPTTELEKKSDESLNLEDFAYPAKRCPSNKLIYKNTEHQTESEQHTNNNKRHSYRPQNQELDDQINKRTLESKFTSNEERSDLLFGSDVNGEEKTNRINKNDNKQYYKTNEAENEEPDEIADKNYEKTHRGRRQVNEPKQSNQKKEFDTNEDEESAIRRHIKKLSDDELEKLLSSLSEDKRELLKKIMDADTATNYDNVNKREITKKAGAVEENNYLESGQVDLSKLQSDSTDTNAVSNIPQNTDKVDTTKQSDSTSETTTVSTARNTESGLSSPVYEEKLLKVQSETTVGQFEADVHKLDSKSNSGSDIQGSKIENKREINKEISSSVGVNFNNENILEDDFNTDELQYVPSDESNVCSQNDLLELEENESKLYQNDDNIYKREALRDNDPDINDSIKSLEESFPNSNAYGKIDAYSEMDMEPLIRVKRKNSDVVIKKRSAALPDTKVGYFPGMAENDNQENDEGDEFDEDGFYERSSNFEINRKAVADDNSQNDISVQYQFLEDSNNNLRSTEKAVKQQKISRIENMESDMTNFGSDTDNILSGVEGVDNNLMFNSGSRNRRSVDNRPKHQTRDALVEQNRSLRSTPIIEDEMNTASANYITVNNYEENDSFGPLPRDYNGESSRYKRIRRVKQPSTSDETLPLESSKRETLNT